MIVGMIACYNIGNQFAGESIYKVWTQESFPVEARASMQGDSSMDSQDSAVDYSHL